MEGTLSILPWGACRLEWHINRGRLWRVGEHVVSCDHIFVRNSRLWAFLCNSVWFSLPQFSGHPI